MSRIPIKSLKELANRHKQDIVIVFAIDSDGETQHVATWGRGIEDCSRAADWGNRMKDKLGWPESLHSQPSRVRKLQKRIKELAMDKLEAIDKNKSFCGCPMCEHHTSAYELKAKEIEP